MRYLLILALFLAVGCTGQESSAPTMSNAEQAAIKKVTDFYGGICDSQIEIKGDTSSAYSKIMNLEITRSRLMEQYESMLEMPASNIAYLFYKNLSSIDSSYTDVRVKIVLRAGQAYEDQYSVQQLKTIKILEENFNASTYALVNKQYEGFMSYFDSSAVKTYGVTATDIGEIYNQISSQATQYKELQMHGFTFLRHPELDIEAVNIAGAIVYANGNVPFTYTMNKANQKLVGLKFEW